MITLTLQPSSPAQYDALIDLLARLRDAQTFDDAQFARLCRDAAAETRAEIDAEVAERPAPAEPEQPKVRRTRKSAPPAPVNETPEIEQAAAPNDETPAPAAEQAPETPAPLPESPASPSEAPTYTLEQVRAMLAGLSQSGKKAEVVALLRKYDATKLTDVPADNYSALMADAQELA